jgi:hypothetical protein
MADELSQQEFAEINAKALAKENSELLKSMLIQQEEINVAKEKEYWRKVYIAECIGYGHSIEHSFTLANQIIVKLYGDK